MGNKMTACSWASSSKECSARARGVHGVTTPGVWLDWSERRGPVQFVEQRAGSVVPRTGCHPKVL